MPVRRGPIEIGSDRARFLVATLCRQIEEARLDRGTALAITEPSVRRSARAVRPGTTLLIVGAGRSPFTSTWSPSHFTDIRRPD